MFFSLLVLKNYLRFIPKNFICFLIYFCWAQTQHRQPKKKTFPNKIPKRKSKRARERHTQKGEIKFNDNSVSSLLLPLQNWAWKDNWLRSLANAKAHKRSSVDPIVDFGREFNHLFLPSLVLKVHSLMIVMFCVRVVMCCFGIKNRSGLCTSLNLRHLSAHNYKLMLSVYLMIRHFFDDYTAWIIDSESIRNSKREDFRRKKEKTFGKHKI